MELNVQYVNDREGNIQAVQIPIKDWKWLQSKFKIFSQELNFKRDMVEAFEDVKLMQKGLQKKQTLTDFINEL